MSLKISLSSHFADLTGESSDVYLFVRDIPHVPLLCLYHCHEQAATHAGPHQYTYCQAAAG